MLQQKCDNFCRIFIFQPVSLPDCNPEVAVNNSLREQKRMKFRPGSSGGLSSCSVKTA